MSLFYNEFFSKLLFFLQKELVITLILYGIGILVIFAHTSLIKTDSYFERLTEFENQICYEPKCIILLFTNFWQLPLIFILHKFYIKYRKILKMNEVLKFFIYLLLQTRKEKTVSRFLLENPHCYKKCEL